MQRSTRIKYSLLHSTWLTSAWNWLMELVGRGAEAILIATVLYQSIKLLPSVHVPQSIDVVVFAVQFAALDIGGLSLGKLAKTAKREGNEEGARLATRMSTALISIMIAGVVVVAVEQLFPIDANWKLGIDTVLLIARSILAVLYSHIIHALKSEDEEEARYAATHDPWTLVVAMAMQQERMAALATHLQESLATIVSDQAAMNTALQQVAAVPQSIDVEAVSEAMRHHVEAVSEAKFASFLRQSEANFDALMRQREARHEAAMRQRVTVSEAHEARQIEAMRQRLEAPKTPHEAAKIVPLRQTEKQPDTASTDKRAAIYALLEAGDTRSSYQLASVVGCSSASAQRYMRDWKAEHDEANREAEQSAM